MKRVHKKNKVRIKLLVQGCNATAIAISDWNPGLLTAPTPLQENAKLKKFTRRRTDRSLTKFHQKSSLELSTQKRIIFEPLLKNQNSFCLTTRYKLIFFICLLNVRVHDFEKHQTWRLLSPKRLQFYKIMLLNKIQSLIFVDNEYFLFRNIVICIFTKK